MDANSNLPGAKELAAAFYFNVVRFFCPSPLVGEGGRDA
jgi:hypothetical protein